jgi:hypothetical protein
MTRGEWLIETSTARRGVNHAVAGYRRGAKAAVLLAERIVLDYDAERVTVYHGGKQAGVMTAAMLWVQMTDDTLSRAVEALADR